MTTFINYLLPCFLKAGTGVGGGGRGFGPPPLQGALGRGESVADWTGSPPLPLLEHFRLGWSG